MSAVVILPNRLDVLILVVVEAVVQRVVVKSVK